MFKIIYDPDYGQVVPDGDVESFVTDYVRNHSKLAKVTIGSEMMLTRFRVAVAEGELDHSMIEFYFKNELIPHRPDGSLTYWPKGMGDLYGLLIKRLTLARRPRTDHTHLKVVE